MRKSAKEALTEYSKVKITLKKKKISRELEPVNKSFLVADLFRAFYEPGTIELNEYLYAVYVDAGKKPLAVVKISDGRLVDLTGKLLRTSHLNGTAGRINLNSTDLENGVYYVRVIRDGLVEFKQKMIVIK